MPKDALTIYRAAIELDMLIGGRIDKVTMPGGDTLILLFHTRGGNYRLLLSCNPSLPRVHITDSTYKNPEVATGTLMYFRKRLTGAVLTDIKKDKCERIVAFCFSALDEMRECVNYTLYAELTGKCANIVFVEQSGIIGNALRKISAENGDKRAVLPGLMYCPPVPTGRVGVFDGERLKSRISEFTGISVRDSIRKCVAGLADSTVDEIFHSLGINDDMQTPDIVDRFTDYAQKLYSLPMTPTVVFDEKDGKPIDFSILPYDTVGGFIKTFSALNRAMDEYYSALFKVADFSAYIKPLRAAVKNAAIKNKKRLAEASEKINECAFAERDRMLGDLITANIYRIKRGDAFAIVDDFYDGNKQIRIELDITKNAQQNAAAYYKSYNKKKKAAVYADDMHKKAIAALDIIDGISAELDLCTEKRELDEVRDELVSLGFIKPDVKRKKDKPAPSEPYVFDIDGATLFVGKNHAQNDRITRDAAKTDLWLHVKGAHGSHAVLKTPHPTERQIALAAQKAAYYSQSRSGENVAVDYTVIKNVFRHGGGKVDYKDYKTVFVTPNNN